MKNPLDLLTKLFRLAIWPLPGLFLKVSAAVRNFAAAKKASSQSGNRQQLPSVRELEFRFAKWSFLNGAGARQKLWRLLANLLNNGVPIVDALQTILDVRRGAGKKNTDPTVIALTEWIKQLRNGRPLSKALQGWAGQDEIMLLAAGEQAGEITTALINATDGMVVTAKIRKAIIGGVTYPALMMILSITVLVMFSFFVVPAFAGTVPIDKWKGTAWIVVTLAAMTRDWIWLGGSSILGVVTIIGMSFPRWTGEGRIKADRVIPWSIYRMVQGGAWMVSLAALVKAGVRVEDALVRLSRGVSPWLRQRVDACLRGMRMGQNIGVALSRSGFGFPDPEIISYLNLYARLSGFDAALSITGKTWVDESVEKIQTMMKVVFGVSVLVVGLFIALMVGGLMDMQLQMATAMKSGY